jgi:hypothetical protein
MKRVIDGRIYDTDKAILIGSERDLSPTDFRFFDAGLYQTKRSKRFFLAGKGGPMTAFGKQCSDGTWTFGEKIIPVDEKAAREWAERYLKPEVVKQLFDISEA